jgi:hypothetical protein
MVKSKTCALSVMESILAMLLVYDVHQALVCIVSYAGCVNDALQAFIEGFEALWRLHSLKLWGSRTHTFMAHGSMHISTCKYRRKTLPPHFAGHTRYVQ